MHTPPTDSLPMTIGHGRKLFNQGKAVATELQTLKPLLALLPSLEEKSGAENGDPISKLITLLEQISAAQQQQAEYTQQVDQKLDVLLSYFNGAEPSDNSNG